jgi:hypothetical protein
MCIIDSIAGLSQDDWQTFLIPTTLGGGGGAVDSVNGQTGVVVLDAGDVQAIPLSGTTEGNPLEGDIQYGVIAEVIIDEEITNKGFYQNEGDNKSGFTFSSDGASSFPVIYNQVGPLATSLVCSESGFVIDSVGASKGISSFNDYSEVDPTNKLIYAQRQYVDDAVANLLPLTRQQFTYTSGAQTFTLTETPSGIYAVFVNGQELNTDQFSIATNVLTIIDTLISGDKVNILYSGQPVGVIPSYTKVETDALFDNSRITVELIDSLEVDFYATDDLKINSFTLIVGSGTITIEVNDSSYTLGTVINQGDKITVSTTTASVVNLIGKYE